MSPADLRDLASALPSVKAIQSDVARAFAEDIGPGDATADLLDPQATATAVLTCRENAVLCGTAWFDACFRTLDPDVRIEWLAHDGDRVAAGSAICRMAGKARALVTAERSALNFLQMLSATATVTARYVDAIAGTRTRVLDTRKTIPGLRMAQKYAVRCGGGTNHRIGLFDAMMLKENHIIAAGGIPAAVRAARTIHPNLPLIVEVETLDELAQAIAAAADRALLDNFTPAMLTDAVALAAGRIPLEVSGNVEIDTIRTIAETGVDFISSGALTKHVRAIDLSLRLDVAA
ncbi:carboxylating nicotinate-nucleotide diphosphorylase [Luteibacter sp. UNCMF366Tsu5.1]|uniref:carboxylating nicotinate-nucleotide diphosphorylase n=1 Tax=Luteibacter sp. UNCMF366Tsu5.1 TaxID=1502758 RepID=UPI000908E3A0|nr:carboxylating nicotinate-nucleotide diphosphorylase [Luteibacter sp. UNCMF366Tsu5.1]SFW61919.1 nicotinate-nucleotide pyrophosphorylase [carboxylating] [Luteibacter sp. UNCMF366Tsu5.1]